MTIHFPDGYNGHTIYAHIEADGVTLGTGRDNTMPQHLATIPADAMRELCDAWRDTEHNAQPLVNVHVACSQAQGLVQAYPDRVRIQGIYLRDDTDAPHYAIHLEYWPRGSDPRTDRPEVATLTTNGEVAAIYRRM